MDLSYVEIEEKKKWVVGLLFLILIVFYFFSAWIIASVIWFPVALAIPIIYICLLKHSSPGDIYLENPSPVNPYLGPNETMVILVIAFIAGLVHWHISLRNTVSKILKVLHAEFLDVKDTYHQRLKNIVEEVRVATGGQEVRCMVIPTTSMNAFSIMGFKEAPVIGVTEGLLSKLKRRQLVAVIGHEMAHIVSGDCLMTTITSALFGLYSEILKGIRVMLKGGLSVFGSGIFRIFHQAVVGYIFFALTLTIVYIITAIVQTMSGIMRIFISRQREYQADAIAVRLVRDPLSLAEAIYTISRNDKTVGYGSLSSIFFMNPLSSSLDEKNGLLANSFSTHPPAKKRIDILLKMARADIKIIEESIKAQSKIRNHEAITVLPSKTSPEKQGWFALDDEGKWTGPFSLLELSNLTWLRPDNWVHKEGEDKVIPAFEDEDLRRMFKGHFKNENISNLLCPHCRVELAEILYEGAPIWRCNYCEGLLVERSKVTRILSRREQGFSDEIARFAKFYQPALKEEERRRKTEQVGAKFFLNCSSCKKMMIRKFYTLAYPIEIDLCDGCNYIWFDPSELEVLQYLIENAG